MADSEAPVELEQVENYRFEVRYPGRTFGPTTVDEEHPVGAGAGPGPVDSLATALGHCLSSTFYNTLVRAHVAVAPLRTVVEVQVGRNERGRLRVQRVAVRIRTAPLHPEDQERFDHCAAIFEDFCTVTGAVRSGIPVESRVDPA
jgi:uncharacterized OsmC-like protein